MQIDVDAMNQHADRMNEACGNCRDFTLINRAVWGSVESHGRMLYSKHVSFVFDADGGFWARHAAGILEYAYPTSQYAVDARKNPADTAKRMLQGVWDSFEFYSTRSWWTVSQERRTELFNKASAVLA